MENPLEPLYGYLCPRSSASNLPYRQISPDIALLFLALQRGVVPEYFCSLLGRRAERFFLRLVLDSILEVEHSGQFVAGRTAKEYLLGDEAYASRGRIAELSINALKYADALGELPVPELTRRLYNFGRRPVTAAQKRAFLHPNTDFFGRLLNSAGSVLSAHWLRSPSADASWIMWRPIRIRGESEDVRYKLYVSPGLSDVAAAFRASADILGQSPGVRGLKIGRGLAGGSRVPTRSSLTFRGSMTFSKRVCAFSANWTGVQFMAYRLRQNYPVMVFSLGALTHPAPTRANGEAGVCGWLGSSQRISRSEGGRIRRAQRGRLC